MDTRLNPGSSERDKVNKRQKRRRDKSGGINKQRVVSQPKPTTKMDAARLDVNTDWKTEKYCVGKFFILKQENGSSYVQHYTYVIGFSQ